MVGVFGPSKMVISATMNIILDATSLLIAMAMLRDTFTPVTAAKPLKAQEALIFGKTVAAPSLVLGHTASKDEVSAAAPRRDQYPSLYRA